MSTLTLYNTLSRKKEKFVPLVKGKAGMYACGPTVYNYAHIGNLRTYIFEDILKRVLQHAGMRVTQVMNITDVGHLTSDADQGEDKMEKGAQREGKTVWEIAQFYTDAFFSDAARLNILRPEVVCRATDHIPEMIALIRQLEKKKHIYLSPDRNLYYDISTFRQYGAMARLHLENLQAGKRIAVDRNKRNPQDFVLWFSLAGSKFKNHVMRWESPWGEGFPGWHIECSAMAMKYLGKKIDIHCGGIDHIPVHHTNEIAQSEGATGKPWVNYWLHGEFLVLDQQKMAKSGGGFITLQTLLDRGFDPLDYRYFTLTAHYRKPLTFSYDALQQARQALSTLRENVLSFQEQPASKPIKNTYANQFAAAIADDLNMPKALAVLWAVVRDPQLGNKEKLALILDFDRVFGLGLAHLERREAAIPAAVQGLVERREQARKQKDFRRADELREEIAGMGFSVNDTPEGPVVKKR